MRYFVCLICLLGFWVAGASPCFAQAKLPPTVIAVVDIQKIMENATASKDIQKTLDAKRSRFQTEIAKEEDSLRKAEKELVAQRALLAAREYSELERQLRQRFSKVESYVRTKRKVLDQSYTLAMDAIRKSLMSIIQDIALARGANVVLVKQNVLWTGEQIDITDEVLKRFDEKFPKIELNFPEDFSTLGM